MSELPAEMQQFLAYFSGPHTFQTIDDRNTKDGRVPKRRWMSGIHHDTSRLLALNEQGAGVFLMINQGDGLGRKNENVTHIRAFFADFDGQPLPESWPLEPSLIVATSPGKFHVYWILPQPIPVLPSAQWNGLQKSLALRVGSCPDDCQGLNRTMRVPGSWHRKNEPFLCQMTEQTDNRYELSQIIAAFGNPSVKLKELKPGRVAPKDLVGQLAAAEPGQRNTTLNRVAFEAGRLIRSGHLRREDIEPELRRAALKIKLPADEVDDTLRRGIEDGFNASVTEKASHHGNVPLSVRLMERIQADGGEWWCDDHGQPYVSFSHDGRLEHHPLPSQSAREYVSLLAYEAEQSVISSQGSNEILGLLGALARRDGVIHPVGLRARHFLGRSYLDLGRPDWQVVELGAGRPRLMPAGECPVRFVRPLGMGMLPVPTWGGSLADLRQFLTVDDDGFLLIIGWLLAGLSGMSPYPVLAIGGAHGQGKSTVSSVLKRLVDPGRATRRSAPRSAQDLFVAAVNAYVLDYENLSAVPHWMSDALCVLSTGGTMTSRELYTDRGESVLEAIRPVIINGIPDLVERADLMDRALVVTLGGLAPSARRSEAEFWHRFTEVQPALLGALCTVLDSALQRLPTVSLPDPPRMADFARLMVAAEPNLPWPAGTFLATYSAMRSKSSYQLLEDDLLAAALMHLMNQGEWKGPVQALLLELTEQAYPDGHTPRDWPRSARGLGELLRRLAPALYEAGYVVEALPRTASGVPYRLYQKSGSDIHNVHKDQKSASGTTN
ncbi:DNA-primase RepB domain-containing protein [Deinococcus puniceus]|uniref:DNA-primase RepB domain-containing protein n=1 Tax=Deinococcus puniceus TaxID=1182568 RepID=UPI0007C93F7D|nr:DNA-primase RepB domain-containing protein [Deinococcus puniceus]